MLCVVVLLLLFALGPVVPVIRHHMNFRALKFGEEGQQEGTDRKPMGEQAGEIQQRVKTL
jgi:hypothetical protein